MNGPRSQLLVCAFMLCAFLACSGNLTAQAATTHPLMNVRQSGDNPIDVQVTTTERTSSSGKTVGLAFTLTLSRKGYVTVLYQSSGKEPIILIPNKYSERLELQPRRQYSIFSDKSPIQLGKSATVENPRIVFYVSTKPLELEPITIPADKSFVYIGDLPAPDVDLISQKLNELALSPGFTRKEILLPLALRPIVRPDLMGLPRALPGKKTSRKPVPVIGSQGVKDESPAPQRK